MSFVLSCVWICNNVFNVDSSQEGVVSVKI